MALPTDQELYEWIERTYGPALSTQTMALFGLVLLDHATIGDMQRRGEMSAVDADQIVEMIRHANVCIKSGHDPLASWQSDQEEPPEDDYLDVEEVPTEFTEPYEETVGAIPPTGYQPPSRPDYRSTKRPDAHEESGALGIPCKTCGAVIGEYCTFATSRVENQFNKRVRVDVAGKRGMPCVSRLLEAAKL